MANIGNPILYQAFVTDQFSGSGGTTFTMSVAPANTASVLVSISGVLQDPSTYSVSGTTLTFSAAPPTGTGNISVRYLGIPATGIVNTAYRTVTEFTATSAQTTFSVPSYTVGFINVYRNGVRLGAADFTATSGTTVVLANACASGDLVVTESFYVSSVLNAIAATPGAVVDSYINSMSASKLTGSRSIPGATMPAGALLGVSYFENSTRTVYGAVAVDCFGTLTVTKSQTSSFLLIDATIMSKNMWSYANNWYVVVNGVTYNGRGGWVDTANSGTNSSAFTRGTRVGPVKAANNVAAGSITINVYIKNNDTGVFDSGLVLNPNSSDDSRYSQQVSSIQVMEIAA